MRLPNFSHLYAAFARAFNRFPLVLLSALIGSLAACLLIDNYSWDWGSNSEDVLFKLVMGSLLGLPLLTALRAFAESRDLKAMPCLICDLIGVAFLVIYFIFNDLRVDELEALAMIRWLGLWLLFHLLAAVLPYWRTANVADFWEYNKQLLSNAVAAALYAFVLFIGLNLAILAVDQLFDLDIDGVIYGQLFVVLTGIFGSIYFLSEFPIQYDKIADARASYTHVVQNLVKYILIPLVIIYFIILYAYSFKIGLQWELPKGWVSKLVLSFSVVGIFTYLLNYQLVDLDENRLVKQFRKWFFYVLAPMLGLLFIGILRRINDYGLTEARYVVLATGIWLVVVSLYFILSKKDDIRFIPISLIPFVLVAIWGPFSAFESGLSSQKARLEQQFDRYNLFENGKLVPLEDTLQHADYQSIRSSLSYLEERNRVSDIADWFSVPFDTLNPLVNAPENVYDLPSGIVHYLKLAKNIVYETGNGRQWSYYFSEPSVIDISGYRTMQRFYFYKDYNGPENRGITTNAAGQLQYRVTDSTSVAIPLNNFLQQLARARSDDSEIKNIEDATLYFERDSIAGRVIINNITFGQDSMQINQLDGMLYLK